MPDVAVRALVLSLVIAARVAPLAAQLPADSLRPDPLRADTATRGPSALRAWQVVAVAGGAVLAMHVLDAPVRDAMADMRSETTDDVAYVFRQVGEPVVWGTVSGGLVLTGVLAHEPGVRDAGLRAGASVLTGLVVVQTIKYVVGRARPEQTEEPLTFDPFSGDESFPSSHTANAFAFATSLSLDIDRWWATAVLYAAATGTAWSRLNDEKHWFSDVAVGAIIGYASARFARGDLTVFGLRAPRVLRAPDGRMALGWSATF